VPTIHSFLLASPADALPRRFRSAPAQAADAATAAAAASPPAEARKPVPWGTFLRSSPVWAIIVAHFCFNWGYYTLLAWLPSYFDMALGEPVGGGFKGLMGQSWGACKPAQGERAALGRRDRFMPCLLWPSANMGPPSRQPPPTRACPSPGPAPTLSAPPSTHAHACLFTPHPPTHPPTTPP
jgi:hypothetical protein